MTDAPNIRGFVIFCDDIRDEINEKQSYIGVYDTELPISVFFPVVLPKLGFGVWYQEKYRAFTKEPVFVHVYMPGDKEDHPTLKAELGGVMGKRRQVLALPKSDTDRERYIQVRANMIASPIDINMPGEIKVLAICGSEMAELGTLLIKYAPNQAFSCPA